MRTSDHRVQCLKVSQEGSGKDSVARKRSSSRCFNVACGGQTALNTRAGKRLSDSRRSQSELPTTVDQDAMWVNEGKKVEQQGEESSVAPDGGGKNDLL